MQLVSDSLSYAEACLCLIETGEREKGNREGSDGKAFSSSHHPPRALKFLIIAFFLSKYPTEASSE